MYEVAKIPLYNGAYICKLEVILLIMNIKAKNGWSNTSVNDLLKYALFLIFFYNFYKFIGHFLIFIYYLHNNFMVLFVL